MINQHLTSLAVALQDVDSQTPRLQSWGAAAAAVLIANGRLLVCGTGGSAEQARHLAARLARSEDDRPPLAAVAVPTDPVTCPSGEDMLAGHIRALGKVGDILLCVSASGTDLEVVSAARTASKLGMTTWALTGPAPNPLATACADAVAVSAAAASTAQEVHLAAVHIFCAAVDSAVRDTLSTRQPTL